MEKDAKENWYELFECNSGTLETMFYASNNRFDSCGKLIQNSRAVAEARLFAHAHKYYT